MSETIFSGEAREVKTVIDAIACLDKGNDAIFDLLGALSVMRDAIGPEGFDNEDTSVSVHTRRGISVIYEALRARYEGIASDMCTADIRLRVLMEKAHKTGVRVATDTPSGSLTHAGPNGAIYTYIYTQIRVHGRG